MSTLAVDMGVELRPDSTRVVARLFLPGESTPGGSSRTQAVLDRILALSPDALTQEAHRIRDHLVGRDPELLEIVLENAAAVRPGAPRLEADAEVVLGAAFTAEFSIEGVSLCNPSAVPHPDQSGLAPGQLRVLMSLRSIGEGHISSIQFGEAVIGADGSWEFLPRQEAPRLPVIEEGEWRRETFLRALEHDGGTDDLVRAIGQVLPDRFGSELIEQAVREVRSPFMRHPDFARHPDARTQLEAMRIVAESDYRAVFPEESALSARVLLPVAEEERHGIEDLRLVHIEDDDGSLYRGTYTAYDGRAIATRLLTTRDFRTFAVERPVGPPVRTKGMALFPRLVGGEHLALSRSDGESIALTRSADGLDWRADEVLWTPEESWEIVQTGNCGSPLETAEGWIVLTHGVGPMRAYGIGALLLDLDDPRRVLGFLPHPLIEAPVAASGYVPHVVYSCGGLIHDGRLWIPYGVDDHHIRVAQVEVAALLAAMTPPASPPIEGRH